MAEKTTKNIYQKLMQARIDFSKKNISTSGYNQHLDFDYLELKDIVPVANQVFQSNGLVLITTFDENGCVGTLMDTDNTESSIKFTIAYRQPEADNRARNTSAIQICGQNITYLRRYMYLLVLDIIVSDEIDSDHEDEAPAVVPAVKATPKAKSEPKTEKKSTAKVVASKASATSEERKEIKKELTDSDAEATKLQVDALKTKMLHWVSLDPDKKPEATKILVATNGFANCTKKEADELLTDITKKIEALEAK